MAKRVWWQKPRLRTGEPGDEPRRVTWLELFYDLVFVIVIGQLSHRFSANISPAGLLEFAFLFVPAWWVWAAGTYYVEYWETEDLSIRVVVFALILPVVGLAVFIHDATGTTLRGYAFSYAIARIVLAVLFFRVGVHDRESRTIAWSYATSFIVVAAMIAISPLVDFRARVALWAMALATELLMPIAVTTSVERLLPHRRATSKLPERFGLFTLIVLGETIVGVFNGLARLHTGAAGIVGVGLLGLSLAFAVWWVYFDCVARRPMREGIWWEFVWGYSHLALLMCIVAIGASLAPVFAGGETALPANLKWMLAGSTALALLVLGLIEIALAPDPRGGRDPRASVGIKFAAGAAALALGLVGGTVNAMALLGGLLGIMAFPVGYEARLWVRQHAT